MLLAAFDSPSWRFHCVERWYTTKLLGQLFLAELAKRVPPIVAIAIINPPYPELRLSATERGGTDTSYFRDVFNRLFIQTPDVGALALSDVAVQQSTESYEQYLLNGIIHA